MIAREQGLLLAEREAHVVRHVTGRVDGFERPVLSLDHRAVGHRDIGREAMVNRGIEPQPPPEVGATPPKA